MTFSRAFPKIVRVGLLFVQPFCLPCNDNDPSLSIRLFDGMISQLTQTQLRFT